MHLLNVYFSINLKQNSPQESKGFLKRCFLNIGFKRWAFLDKIAALFIT